MLMRDIGTTANGLIGTHAWEMTLERFMEFGKVFLPPSTPKSEEEYIPTVMMSRK